VAQRLVRLDIPLMIGVSVLVLVLALDGLIGQWDGLLLLFGILAYTVFVIRQSRYERAAVVAEYEHELGGTSSPQSSRIVQNIGLIFAGLVLLVLGARWLVSGAVAIATALGVSELVIGLTIVAIGTGAPELATTVIASVRGERDIAIGNVVGSNLFNLLLVLGTAAFVAPTGIIVPPAAVRFDLPVMIVTAVACLPIYARHHMISRWQGLLFLGYYAAYTTYLSLAAAAHTALPVFSRVMLLFVVPLTAITLLVLAVRTVRTKRLNAV
jgi:cation:H+ antiporter